MSGILSEHDSSGCMPSMVRVIMEGNAIVTPFKMQAEAQARTQDLLEFHPLDRTESPQFAEMFRGQLNGPLNQYDTRDERKTREVACEITQTTGNFQMDHDVACTA